MEWAWQTPAACHLESARSAYDNPPRDTAIELWYKDQRTKSTDIFGALCPELGKGAGLVLPFCNTQAMTLHLAEISLAIEPGARGVLLMDQAGWHLTGKLEMQKNISTVPLSPKCPELNPVENIWQYMGDNWLSNRVFTSDDNIIDQLLRGLEQAHRSAQAYHDLGRRNWAHAS